MNTEKLAPVFLDNQPVTLTDARPNVSAILSAGGKPKTTHVNWLQFQANSPAKAMSSEEVLDRTTTPTVPIYLTSQAGGQESSAKPPKGAEGRAEHVGSQARPDSPTRAAQGSSIEFPKKTRE